MSKRPESDRRVQKIMSAFDRAVASPHGPACGNHLPWAVTSCIVSHGSFAEDFQGWEYEGLRAVLLSYAINAPAGDLAAMAREATKQIAFVKEWDARGCAEAGGCKLIVQQFARLAMELHAVAPERLKAIGDKILAKAASAEVQ